VVTAESVDALKDVYPSLNNLRVFDTTHCTDFDRAVLGQRVKVKTRVVKTVVKVGGAASANERTSLAENSRSVLSTKAEQVAYSVVTTPRSKNLLNCYVQRNKRTDSVKVEVSSVKVDVNRRTVALVKDRAVFLEHVPEVLQCAWNSLEGHRLLEHVLCVVLTAKRAVVNVHPFVRNKGVCFVVVFVVVVVVVFSLRELITLYLDFEAYVSVCYSATIKENCDLVTGFIVL
jgi:hypothetical protein